MVKDEVTLWGHRGVCMCSLWVLNHLSFSVDSPQRVISGSGLRCMIADSQQDSSIWFVP